MAAELIKFPYQTEFFGQWNPGRILSRTDQYVDHALTHLEKLRTQPDSQAGHFFLTTVKEGLLATKSFDVVQDLFNPMYNTPVEEVPGQPASEATFGEYFPPFLGSIVAGIEDKPDIQADLIEFTTHFLAGHHAVDDPVFSRQFYDFFKAIKDNGKPNLARRYVRQMLANEILNLDDERSREIHEEIMQQDNLIHFPRPGHETTDFEDTTVDYLQTVRR